MMCSNVVWLKTVLWALRNTCLLVYCLFTFLYKKKTETIKTKGERKKYTPNFKKSNRKQLKRKQSLSTYLKYA